ncbi:hypothetical protein MUG91_G51n1, partial [Manis pentadactyla]
VIDLESNNLPERSLSTPLFSPHPLCLHPSPLVPEQGLNLGSSLFSLGFP